MSQDNVKFSFMVTCRVCGRYINSEVSRELLEGGDPKSVLSLMMMDEKNLIDLCRTDGCPGH